MPKTTLVVRDTESTQFQPSVTELPSDINTVISYKKQQKAVSAAVKLAATHALKLSPEQLSNMNRLFAQKNAGSVFGNYASLSGFASVIEVLRYDDHFEVCIRACADKSFLKDVEDAANMIKNDCSKLRRLPMSCLSIIKTKIEDKSLDLSMISSAGKKILKDAMNQLPDDESGDLEDASCRIDFSAFAVVSGAKSLTSATKLAVTRTDLKRKRVMEDEQKNDLSRIVEHVRLPNGMVAFCFKEAKTINVVGDAVMVEFKEKSDFDEAVDVETSTEA